MRRGGDAFLAFHAELFAAQPDEGGPGLPDGELVDLAARAGAGGADVAADIRDLRFAAPPWGTDLVSRGGMTGTSTVLVDGTPLVDRAPGALEAAVHAAASGR